MRKLVAFAVVGVATIVPATAGFVLSPSIRASTIKAVDAIPGVEDILAMRSPGVRGEVSLNTKNKKPLPPVTPRVPESPMEAFVDITPVTFGGILPVGDFVPSLPPMGYFPPNVVDFPPNYPGLSVPPGSPGMTTPPGIVTPPGGTPPIITPPIITPPEITPPVPAVPEPASWLMMILGFAVTGWFIRKKDVAYV